MNFSDLESWNDMALPYGDVPTTRKTIYAFCDGIRHDKEWLVFLATYPRYLKRYAKRVFPNHYHISEHVYEQLLCKLREKHSVIRLKPGGHFRSFIFSLYHNLYRDQIKSEGRRLDRERKWSEDLRREQNLTSAEKRHLMNTFAIARAAFVYGTDHEAVEAAGITQEQRAAWIWRHEEDVPVHEIAAKLYVTEKTVYNHCAAVNGYLCKATYALLSA